MHCNIHQRYVEAQGFNGAWARNFLCYSDQVVRADDEPLKHITKIVINSMSSGCVWRFAVLAQASVVKPVREVSSVACGSNGWPCPSDWYFDDEVASGPG